MRQTVRRLRVIFRVCFRADARIASLAMVLSIIGNVAGPLSALWLKKLVDAATAGDQSTAVGAAIALAASWVVSMLAGHASTYVAFALEIRVIRLVLFEVMEMSGRVPTIELEERPDVADRIRLIRGDVKPFAFAMTSTVWAVGMVTRLTTTVLVLISVSRVLALLPLLGIPSLVAGAWAQKLRQRVREDTVEDDRLSDNLAWLVSEPESGKELRIFGLASEITGRHRSLRSSIQLRQRRAEVRAAFATSVGWLLYAAGYAGAIVFVTLMAIDGRATAGDVLLVVDLSAQIQIQLDGAVTLIGQFIQTLRAADHYLWLRDLTDRVGARREPTASVPVRLSSCIRFEGVSFRYPDTDTDVLRDIDLTIPAGTALAIVGVNGAGKTTLAKLLAGFYEPTEGRITVDGADMRDLDLNAWRRRMSACFQDFMHFEYVAQESVGLGDLPRIDDERTVGEALERANGADVVESLPDGLRTLLGREYGDGVELSTGQWQKLALGRAMMREDPLLLIFDEPTASLDAYTEHALFERYAQASERAGGELGAITVLISHRFSTVRMADTVVVLEDGRIVQSGTHAELEREQGAYRELYDLQSRAYR
jgi:ATP-binding cassette, subfamily B, bacterial